MAAICLRNLAGERLSDIGEQEVHWQLQFVAFAVVLGEFVDIRRPKSLQSAPPSYSSVILRSSRSASCISGSLVLYLSS